MKIFISDTFLDNEYGESTVFTDIIEQNLG